MPWTSKPLSFPGRDFQCPPVNVDCIYDHHASEGSKVHPSAHSMYRDGAVVSLLCGQEGGKTFIRCAIKSEMTKRVRYRVLAVILSSGAVQAANCECTAGSGARATCKHVAVVLFALEGLSRSGKVILEKTCTEVAQAWHQPRKAVTGSPLKVAEMSYKRKVQPEAKVDEAGPPEPVGGKSQPVTQVEGEHERIMNLIYNFQVNKYNQCHAIMCSRRSCYGSFVHDCGLGVTARRGVLYAASKAMVNVGTVS